ncbi:alpha beta hydrolase fold-3 domain protein [Colletotrichum sojae]|uniref:Alpha beta hydrolase fold-3 domain protein n=1 Tax=Colletotrichum sojae TaxID=2175907 RepID=A0A8H6JBY4_9PEZI|nr:alpha beta hydrolase fold-3 domain protein [Colletotrichum sojae]
MMVTEATVPPRYAHLFRSRQKNADPEGRITAMTRELEELIGETASTPWLSPINLALSTAEIARGHPPKVYSYAGGLDPFRDDCVIYNDWLSGLPGVKSRMRLLEDENHTGWVTLPIPACHSRTIKEATLDGMAWLLGVEWDKERTELPW